MRGERGRLGAALSDPGDEGQTAQLGRLAREAGELSVREGRLTLSWLVWLQTCRPHLQTPPEISSVSKNGQNCTGVPYLELLHDVGPTGEVEQPDVVDLADPGKAGDDSLHQLQVARLDLDLHPPSSGWSPRPGR